MATYRVKSKQWSATFNRIAEGEATCAPGGASGRPLHFSQLTSCWWWKVPSRPAVVCYMVNVKVEGNTLQHRY
jgi:hypothetical protein